MTWDLSSVVVKLLSLVAVASVVGGAFCLFLTKSTGFQIRNWLLVYMRNGALVGVIASSLYFLIQIGAINQAGLSGMFDSQIGFILAQSGLGYSSALRVCGFTLILGILLFDLIKVQNVKPMPNISMVSLILLIVSFALLGISFSLTGHVADLSFLAGISIDLHILAMSLWLGSLYPLWYLCGVESADRLKILMQRFGEIAVNVVCVLVFTGLFLLTRLLNPLSDLFSTPYGRMLLFKLLGVTGLLTLAAINKLRIVPKLDNKNVNVLLKRSIMLEMGVALFVLLVTSYFTTLVGPDHGG